MCTKNVLRFGAEMDFTTDLQIRKWTPAKDQEIKRVGKGLYLRGFRSGRKVFQIRYKQKWIDLGDYGEKSLSTATELSLASIRKLKENLISINQLKASLNRATSTDDLNTEIERKIIDSTDSKSGIPTFDELYRQWYALQLKANRWTHKSSISKPIRAYELHAEADLGNKRVDKITRLELKRLLQPVYLEHRDLGPDLRGFIDEVLEDAVDAELIENNPCPPHKRFTLPQIKTRHSASLEFTQLPKLWSWLEEAPFSFTVKVAMRTAIITAHRASVVAFARWNHINLEDGLWSIPERPDGVRHQGYMKSGRAFTQKLPDGLLQQFEQLLASNEEKTGEFVFEMPNKRPMHPETLRRNFQKFGTMTSHGLRNSFKTWALHEEVDQFVVDRYVDHSLQGLDRAYRRDDMFNERTLLANKYYNFVTGAA